MSSFSQTVDLLHRAMDVSSLRYEVSAHNLSMSEVPNYKRQSVSFESELKRVMEAGGDYRAVEPRLTTDYLSTSKANGNNVDAEQEAMDILKTQLNYQLLTQLQTFQFSQIQTAIKR